MEEKRERSGRWGIRWWTQGPLERPTREQYNTDVVYFIVFFKYISAVVVIIVNSVTYLYSRVHDTRWLRENKRERKI